MSAETFEVTIRVAQAVLGTVAFLGYFWGLRNWANMADRERRQYPGMVFLHLVLAVYVLERMRRHDELVYMSIPLFIAIAYNAWASWWRSKGDNFTAADRSRNLRRDQRPRLDPDDYEDTADHENKP